MYLNGEKLARHEGGYSTFRVNLTEHLKEQNTLAVSVTFSIVNTAWAWPPAGVTV